MVQIPVNSRHSPKTFLFNLALHADPCQLFVPRVFRSVTSNQAVCSHLRWIAAIRHFWCKFWHRVSNLSFFFFVYAGVDSPQRGGWSCRATGNSTCPGNYLNLSAFVQWLSSELSQQKPGATMNVFLWLRWRRIADTPPSPTNTHPSHTHTQKTRQLHAACGTFNRETILPLFLWRSHGRLLPACCCFGIVVMRTGEVISHRLNNGEMWMGTFRGRCEVSEIW